MARVQSGPRAKKVSATKPTVAGFLPFGENDSLPQTLIDVIDNSDTATAAVTARAEFIIGNGIDDQALADMVVNRDGETLDMVAEGMAWNIAYDEVVCLLIGYNGNGQVVSLRSVGWEQVRLVEPDERGKLTHGGIFPFLDSSFKKNKKTEHTLLPLFNDDPAVVLSQIAAVNGIQNYYGQLLYMKVGAPSSGYYAVPSWFGTVKNMETEAELTEYDFATAVNGFNISGIWKELKSDPAPVTDVVVADDDAALRRRREREEEDQDSTVARLSDNQGGENGGKIVVVQASNIDELKAMDFVPTTGVQLADRYNSTNQRVMERIARRMRTPNELLNIRRAGGIAPTGEEMKVASQIMQQSVNKYQRRIDQVLARVLSNWHEPLPENVDFKLENLNYFMEAPAAAEPTNPPSDGNPIPAN